MEILIVLLALLSQILGLCGFVFSCLLFLRFGKIKSWFNKKAGTEIVSSFSFRSLRTLIITGVLGSVIAEGVLKLFKITDPVAKGIAIGTASHAVGTSKAMEIGKTEGAMSGLSIVVSGLLTVAGASVFASFL